MFLRENLIFAIKYIQWYHASISANFGCNTFIRNNNNNNQKQQQQNVWVLPRYYGKRIWFYEF